MLETPKVSVIVPVYNVEQYLPRCLDSLINQTLKELEIVIVNDGSPDGSQQIIDSYQKQYPTKIKALKKENGGLSDARNFGLDNANGEFIAFVDSDDWVDLDMMQQMYDLAILHQAQMVICSLEKVDEHGKAFRSLPQSPQLPEKIELDKDFGLFGEMSCFACNKLFHNSLFKENRFQKGIHFEDIELIPKLLLKCQVVAKTNQAFYKYFERQDSITRTHNKKGLDMFLAIDSVTKAFHTSQYKHQIQELKRFQIIQGFYSYLAYVAYVKDKELKTQMLQVLYQKLTEYGLRKTEIKSYERFNQNYLQSLPIKKRVFYALALFNLKLITIF